VPLAFAAVVQEARLGRCRLRGSGRVREEDSRVHDRLSARSETDDADGSEGLAPTHSLERGPPSSPEILDNGAHVPSLLDCTRHMRYLLRVAQQDRPGDTAIGDHQLAVMERTVVILHDHLIAVA